MSCKVQALVWERYPLGGTKLLVMLALANEADGSGCVHPCATQLSKATRTTPGNAAKVVAELVKDGFLVLAGVTHGGIDTVPVKQYRIVVEKLGG